MEQSPIVGYLKVFFIGILIFVIFLSVLNGSKTEEKIVALDSRVYTLNETVPTASSPVYGGPLVISNTTMLRAVSIGANGKVSHLVSESYIELGNDMLDDNTNLNRLGL